MAQLREEHVSGVDCKESGEGHSKFRGIDIIHEDHHMVEPTAYNPVGAVLAPKPLVVSGLRRSCGQLNLSKTFSRIS